MLKKIILTTLLLLSVAAAVAPASEPRHPFSQITPVDVNLNMSRMNIFNVTEVDLYSGLVFSGNVIQTPGNADMLLWNGVENRIDIEQDVNTGGNNLNLSGGNLTSDTEVCIGDQC